MPNPFPGVNPFIEATGDLWVGFHNVLISQMSLMLNADLMPRGYAAFVDKRVDLIDTLDADGTRIPDVAVVRPRRGPDPASGGATAAVLDLEPTDLENPSYEAVPVAFIQIRALPGQHLVTGIELLSPANKGGSGRGEYAIKRAELLEAKVNLLEIDLLLGGRPPELVGTVPAGHFHAFVTRGDDRRRCQAYAWSLRAPLPRLPVPLRSRDEDATLDLPNAYRTTYDGGPYELTLPYDRPLPGPLSDADRAWTAERAAAAAGGPP